MQKLDQNGNMLLEITVPNHGAAIRDFTDDGASITRYKGSWGKLRLSMRHLDEQEITDEIPAYSFDRVEKLEKGQMVEDDIVMSPVGMAFHKGESIRLILSSKKEYRNSMMQPPPPRLYTKELGMAGNLYRLGQSFLSSASDIKNMKVSQALPVKSTR